MASVSRAIQRTGEYFKKRAIAYARFSSNNQREESIDAQLRAIREYCAQEDIELIAEFSDEAISGKTDDREEFQNMINQVIKGHLKVDYILVHKFNRFARNKYDSAIYKKKLKDIGVKVISVSQKIDETPEGELLEGFLEVIDQYYTANLAVEVRKGLRENALKGMHAGGQVLFGYSLDKDGYYIPNENAVIVQRIFEEFASGYPKTEICERLNREGYRNQRGMPFNTRTLYDLLRNEKYIGNYVYTIDKKETIRLDGIIKDPPIDKKLWERVQTLCANPPAKGRNRTQKRFYFLTGKAVCEHCGSNICGAGSKRSRNGDLNYYYKCVGKVKHKNGCTATSINKDWLEPRILKTLVNVVMNDDQIKRIAKQAYDQLEIMKDTPVVTTEQLQKELSEIIKKQTRLADLYLDGDIDKETLDERKRGFQRRKYQIEEELDKRKHIADASDITPQDIEEYIKEYVTEIKETSETDDEFMRAMFAAFLDRVVIGKEKITVHIHADFSRMGGGDKQRLCGLLHHLAPAKMDREIARKKHLRDVNEQ